MTLKERTIQLMEFLVSQLSLYYKSYIMTNLRTTSTQVYICEVSQSFAGPYRTVRNFFYAPPGDWI